VKKQAVGSRRQAVKLMIAAVYVVYGYHLARMFFAYVPNTIFDF